MLNDKNLSFLIDELWVNHKEEKSQKNVRQIFLIYCWQTHILLAPYASDDSQANLLKSRHLNWATRQTPRGAVAIQGWSCSTWLRLNCACQLFFLQHWRLVCLNVCILSPVSHTTSKWNFLDILLRCKKMYNIFKHAQNYKERNKFKWMC